MNTQVPLLLIVLVAAAGCASPGGVPAPPPSEPTPPAAAPPAATVPTPAAPASEERAYTFSCDNGERIQVRFSRTRKLATLVRGGDSVELPQQPSGSGFIYGNDRTTLRGKGDELILEVGKMAPVRCREG